jgi:hypothetical protein
MAEMMLVRQTCVEEEKSWVEGVVVEVSGRLEHTWGCQGHPYILCRK